MRNELAERRGRFVVLEGVDGSGKSTQARLLAESLHATLTREPGGTRLGESLRALLLGEDSMAEPDGPLAPETDEPWICSRAEALMMAASRAQHVAEVIEPALAVGRHVVSDRFTPSSIAYQGAARGLGAASVSELSRFAAPAVTPDLVVLIDLDPEIAMARFGSHDRIEASGVDLQRTVRRSYLDQAAADPGHWLIVDGCLNVDELRRHIGEGVRARLGLLAPS